MAITSQHKMSNNSEMVRDTRNMSMNNDYETGIALSDSVVLCETTPSGEITMMSFPVGNKTRYLGNHATQTKSYYGTLLGCYGPSFRIRHIK